MSEVEVYVGNLPFPATESDLEAWFKEEGGVTVTTKIIRDRETGRSRGFGFATLSDASEIEKALELDGKVFQERSLKINRSNKSTTGGGGGGGGGGGRQSW